MWLQPSVAWLSLLTGPLCLSMRLLTGELHTYIPKVFLVFFSKHRLYVFATHIVTSATFKKLDILY